MVAAAQTAAEVVARVVAVVEVAAAREWAGWWAPLMAEVEELEEKAGAEIHAPRVHRALDQRIRHLRGHGGLRTPHDPCARRVQPSEA